MRYKLIDICSIEKGKVGIQKAIPGEYPLVVTAEERLTCNEYQFDTKAVCIPLVSSTGHGHASLKRVHYQEGKFALGNILCAVIPKDEKVVLAEYLYVYFSIMKDDVLVPLMKGAANVALTVTDLKNIVIPIPDINNQQKIIKKYKLITSNINNIKNYNNNIDNNIGYLYKQIINDAVNGVLYNNSSVFKSSLPSSTIDCSEYPDNWKVYSHNDLFEIVGGSQPPKSHFKSEPGEGLIQLYQTRDYGENPQPVYIKKSETNKFTKKGDIILARYGGSLGKVFWAEDGAYNVALAKVIIKYPELINKDYLYYYYLSDIYQLKVKSGNRSAQAGFSKDDLNNMVFPLPPIEIQNKIVAKVNKIISFIDEIKYEILKCNESYDYILKVFLSNFFDEIK